MPWRRWPGAVARPAAEPADLPSPSSPMFADPMTPSDSSDGAPADPGPVPDVRVTVFVRGHVQGVGFRWWTRARALELGLVGHARNTDDGRVEVVVQGSRGAVDTLVRLLAEQPSTARRPGRVFGLSAPLISAPHEGIRGFRER